jgi:hypothetical protein
VGKSVTSMRSLLGRTVDLQEVAARFAAEFGSVFGREIVWLSGCELDRKLREYADENAVA